MFSRRTRSTTAIRSSICTTEARPVAGSKTAGRERDDKTFPWICIKKERFPRIFSTRTVTNDGSKYYGPYASVRMMNTVLELIQQLYPLRNCNYNLSEENIKAKKFKVCLEYHLGNCLGPCEDHQTDTDYDLQIAQIREIIKGNISSLMKHFKNLMKKHSDEFQFEKAQIIKEKIVFFSKCCFYSYKKFHRSQF